VLAAAAGGAEPAGVARPVATPDVVAGNTAFALALYRELSATPGNVFFSPFSMALALTMTAEGARGSTAEEMGRALHLADRFRRQGPDGTLRPWDLTEVHRSFSLLTRELAGPNDAEREALRHRLDDLRRAATATRATVDRIEKQGHDRAAIAKARAELGTLWNQADAAEMRLADCTLRTANSLWGERSYPFREEYAKAVADHYGTGSLIPVDFLDDYPGARQIMNRWTAEQTGGRITDIVPELPPMLASLMRLVLINAVYFRGDWTCPFDDAATRPSGSILFLGRVARPEAAGAPVGSQR
jgi:hypothetical protein